MEESHKSETGGFSNSLALCEAFLGFNLVSGVSGESPSLLSFCVGGLIEAND